MVCAVIVKREVFTAPLLLWQVVGWWVPGNGVFRASFSCCVGKPLVEIAVSSCRARRVDVFVVSLEFSANVCV